MSDDLGEVRENIFFAGVAEEILRLERELRQARDRRMEAVTLRDITRSTNPFWRSQRPEEGALRPVPSLILIRAGRIIHSSDAEDTAAAQWWRGLPNLFEWLRGRLRFTLRGPGYEVADPAHMLPPFLLIGCLQMSQLAVLYPRCHSRLPVVDPPRVPTPDELDISARVSYTTFATFTLPGDRLGEPRRTVVFQALPHNADYALATRVDVFLEIHNGNRPRPAPLGTFEPRFVAGDDPF